MNTRCRHDQRRGVIALLIAIAAAACGGGRQETPASPPAGTPPAAGAPIPPTPSPFDAFPASVRQVIDRPFTGDLDELIKRRAIRVAVTYNRTHYFIDNGQERGLTYEAVKSIRDRPEHGAEDGQPQGPRRDPPDVA